MAKGKHDTHHLIEEKSELKLLFELVKEIRRCYPFLYWRVDFAAGLKLPPRIAGMQAKLQKSDKYPDIFFPKPIKPYCGLYVEYKRDRSEVYNKDGSMVQDDHIRKQYQMLQMLNGLGYKAVFGFGVEHTLNELGNYLSGQS